VPKPFYRRNLPHLQRDCNPHFLTFCAYQRRTLPESARTIVMETCMRANQWTIDLRAVVVMPDHVHMIFTPYQILRQQQYSRWPELQEPSRALQRT
jgi:REP element-mobilizing transposase RayT